jgi:hypothetical protein
MHWQMAARQSFMAMENKRVTSSTLMTLSMQLRALPTELAA